MIAELIIPNEGRITLDWNMLVDTKSHKHPVEPEDRDIGMVFQSYAV